LAGGFGVGVYHGVGAPQFRGLLRGGYTALSRQHGEKRKRLLEAKYGPEKPPQVEWAVFELKEKCPSKQEDYNPEVHDPGCHQYYSLTEIAALTLNCPSQEGNYDPAVHDAACPKVYELRKDLSQEEYAVVYLLAAADLAARCPEDPVQFDPVQHDQSCPKFFELRERVSLVARCPSDPGQFDPNLHDPGCPKVYTLEETLAVSDIQAIHVLAQSDTDHDGILDLDDRCPQITGVAAAMGCQEERFTREIAIGQVLGTTLPITFGSNQFAISPGIAKSLSDAASVLIDHPRIRLVRIEGHADGRGSKRVNQRISLKRAESVRRFLISCGVDPERLKAVGLGASQPIACNETEVGRAKNRRATVLVVEVVESQ
jgi:outer membrane protein OmpA-like peptidoglycan-associated protein